jgi:hypothetical protein
VDTVVDWPTNNSQVRPAPKVWDVYHDEPGKVVHYRALECWNEGGVLYLRQVTGDVVADEVQLSAVRGALRISSKYLTVRECADDLIKRHTVA